MTGRKMEVTDIKEGVSQRMGEKKRGNPKEKGESTKRGERNKSERGKRANVRLTKLLRKRRNSPKELRGEKKRLSGIIDKKRVRMGVGGTR